nr:reverse transcriptase domain-containing protein [Tanacetum cinerariifolium]
MPTKIELTLEQSQQGVSYDVLVSIEGVEELKRNVWIKGENKAALQRLLGKKSVLHPRSSKFEFIISNFQGEIVTHWFTLIVLSALRHSGNENMLGLVILILRSILTDLQVTPTKPGRMAKPYSSHRFIASYFNVGNLKMEVKGEIVRYMKSISHSIEIRLSPQEAKWAIGRPKAMMRSILAHLGWPKYRQIMAHVTRQGPNTLPNNTNPNNMTPESIQAMIDQALLRNSTNRDKSHSSHEDNRRNVQTARPCFYGDFMKCQPLNFKGTKGMVGLTRWIEKMESVFQISGCAIENQVKFATCTIGLPDNIYGNVKASKPRTLDETIELANDLMDQQLRTYTERKTSNKRKVDDSFRNNHGHQQQTPKRQNVARQTPKRQNVARVYNIGTGEKKPYSGQVHQVPFSSQWPVYPEVPQVNNGENPKGNGCFECGAPGHFKRDYPKLKNKDGGKVNAPIWVYTDGNAEKRGNASRDLDSNVVTEGKQLEDVPVIRDFPEVFPKDLLGLPPARPVEFQIDLFPGAALIDEKEYEEHLKAILELLKKEKFAPILALPERSEDFVVYCDASHKGLSAVLMQSEKELNMRQHRWLKLLSDYDCEIRYHPRKENIVANALSRKERIEPLRVRALVMIIGLDLPKQILEDQIEALKP